MDDIGFSKTSLEWTYILPTTGRNVTSDFSAEYRDIGEPVRELLNAAKRRLAHKRPHSIRNAVTVLRDFLHVASEFCKRRTDPMELLKVYETALRDDESITEGSKWSYYNVMSGILKEFARVKLAAFHAQNPFVKNAFSQKPLLHGEELVPIIDQARRDAYTGVSAFRAPPVEYVPFIEEARLFLRNGVFIAGDVRIKSKPEVQLFERWHKATGLRLCDLTQYIYPSSNELLPLLLLLSFPLATNPDTISLLRLSGIVSLLHPNKGAGYQLSLDKPRSGEVPQIFVRESGTLSPGWLINAVKEMTASIRPFAREEHQDYLFLCGTRYGNIGPLIGSLRYLAMRRYLDDRGFPSTTLKALRSARLTDEWIERRDPMRVWKLHGGSSFALVAPYVLRAESEATDDAVMADIQRSLERPKKGTADEKRAQTESGVMPTHTCKNIFDRDKKKDEHGFCVSYLWPYNDEHFIFLLEPRPVALLLRDYGALCEAQKCMAQERFAKRYAAKKELLELEFLPLISDELLEEARKLIPELPPHPSIVSVL